MISRIGRVWRRLRRSRWARGAAVVLVAVLLFEYVVLPQLVGSDNVVAALAKLPWAVLAAATGLEVASWLSYSALTRVVLPGSTVPGYFTLVRIDLVDTAVNHVTPGGGATSAAERFHLLTRCGVQDRNALSAATVQTVGANLLLGVLFCAGLLLGAGRGESGPYFRSAAVVILVLLAVCLLALLVLDRHLDAAIRTAGAAARFLRFIQPAAAERFVETMAAEAQMFRSNPRRLAAGAGFGVLRWVFDAAVLWTFLAAFGHTLDPAGLLLAYALAQLVALVPLTPGGLGLVEGVLVPTLAGLGAPTSAAVSAVLCWRVIQFWLPIAVGLLAYLSLRVGVLARARPAGGRGPRPAQA